MLRKKLTPSIFPDEGAREKPKTSPVVKKPWGNAKVNLNILRITLFVSLVVTAGLGGYFSYRTLRRQEERIEEISFSSVTSQIEEVGTHSITAKIKSLHSYRVFLKSNCPTLESWPNCTVIIDDYNTFATAFVVAADVDTCNHEALVRSDEIGSFVANAATFYSDSGYQDVAAAVRGGIFAVNESNYELYTVKKPSVGGENDFILPILQIIHPDKNVGALMFNIYSGMDRMTLIDDLYSCVRALDGTQQPANFSIDQIGEQCMVVTKVIKVVEDVEFRPAVIMLYPMMLQVDNITDVDPTLLEHRIVIDVNDKTFVHVGSMSVIFYWDRVLTKAVSQKTDGLHILLNDGSDDYYYSYEDGTAVYHPDMTISESSRLKVSFPITTSLSNSDFIYTLTIQGDHTFSDKYYTNGPIFACILFTWAQIDQAKRNFVRYISHEIRTPLTTVGLGINLAITRLKALSLMTNKSCSGDLPLPPGIDKKNETADMEAIKKLSSHACADEGISHDKNVAIDMLDVLESVEGSVEVAVLILTDLLNYDKIQNGTLELSYDYWNACQLVNQVATSFQVAAQAAEVTLVVTCEVLKSFHIESDMLICVTPSKSDEENNVKDFNDTDVESMIPQSSEPSLVLFSDAVKLHQVLRNLISNAIKFTPEGGTVTVTSVWDKIYTLPLARKNVNGSNDMYDAAGTFVVTIQDNGVGISAENLSEVFSDGWQFKANLLQAGQGSGLGLWITKNIVEKHQGRLTCHSEGLGKGCTMRLELPVLVKSTKLDDSGEGPFCSPTRDKIFHSLTDKSSSTSLYSEHTGSGKRILVVDDSSMCRKMVCRFLRSLSYECVEATNGADCVAKMNSSHDDGNIMDTTFDFVLLDYEMPVMDGPSACKLLRESGYQLPIIGLTGNVLKVDTDHFIECGATAVMTKPFVLEDFVKIINKI